MSAIGRGKTPASLENRSYRLFIPHQCRATVAMARATFPADHVVGAPGGSSAEGISVPCPGSPNMTLPAWFETVTFPLSSRTPYLSSGPPQNSVPRTAISANGVDTAMLLSFISLMRPVAKRKAPLVACSTVSPMPRSGIAVDHDARMFAESKLSFVEERNLKLRIGARAQLVLQMHGRADCGSDGTSGRDD